MKPSLEREQKLFDALKHIAVNFDTVERIKRNSDKDFGISGEEALEYAYENMQRVARSAVRGMRRPQTNQAPSKDSSDLQTKSCSTSVKEGE